MSRILRFAVGPRVSAWHTTEGQHDHLLPPSNTFLFLVQIPPHQQDVRIACVSVGVVSDPNTCSAGPFM